VQEPDHESTPKTNSENEQERHSNWRWQHMTLFEEKEMLQGNNDIEGFEYPHQIDIYSEFQIEILNFSLSRQHFDASSE
jgi:hypothetical protein